MKIFALTLALSTVAAFPAAADELVTLNHNGSVMELRVDYANNFKLIYSQPREGLLTAGVKPGTILVQGSLRKGGELVANAAAFKKDCPPLYYPVKGRIEAGAELVLSGPGPVRAERCTIKGLSMDSVHSTLKFTRADGSMFVAGVLNPPPAAAATVAKVDPMRPLSGAEMAAAAKGGAQAPQANPAPAPVAVPAAVAQPAPTVEAKAEPVRQIETAPAMPIGPVPSIEKKPETPAPVAATRPVERVETPAPAATAAQPKAVPSAIPAAAPAPVSSPTPQVAAPQVEPEKPVKKTVDADL